MHFDKLVGQISAFVCHKARVGTCFGNNFFSFCEGIMYHDVSECYCCYCNKKINLGLFKVGMELEYFLIGNYAVSMCLNCAPF